MKTNIHENFCEDMNLDEVLNEPPYNLDTMEYNDFVPYDIHYITRLHYQYYSQEFKSILYCDETNFNEDYTNETDFVNNSSELRSNLLTTYEVYNLERFNESYNECYLAVEDWDYVPPKSREQIFKENRIRCEKKRCKQGLKRKLLLEKKKVEKYYTTINPNMRKMFDEFLNIGMDSKDIYLLQKACFYYRFRNFYEMIQSRNIYHYEEEISFEDKRFKEKLPKTIETIKFSLSFPTEMFLRTLVGLTIFTEIDERHEAALVYGLKKHFRFEHEQLLKRFYKNKYLFKQISQNLYDNFNNVSSRCEKFKILRHYNKYHLTKSMIIRSIRGNFFGFLLFKFYLVIF